MNFSETNIFRAPPGTGAALQRAADLEGTKASELLRRMVEHHPLASDGIDKARSDFAQEAVWAISGLRVLRIVADCKGVG
jgi:hypothetical protein